VCRAVCVCALVVLRHASRLPALCCALPAPTSLMWACAACVRLSLHAGAGRQQRRPAAAPAVAAAAARDAAHPGRRTHQRGCRQGAAGADGRGLQQHAARGLAAAHRQAAAGRVAALCRCAGGCHTAELWWGARAVEPACEGCASQAVPPPAWMAACKRVCVCACCTQTTAATPSASCRACCQTLLEQRRR
jgi:hypothetical protein